MPLCDREDKKATVQPGPKPSPLAPEDATPRTATGRSNPDRGQSPTVTAAPPARRQVYHLLPVRAKVLGSEDAVPTPVVATLEVIAEATTLSDEEQLG
jgi:hypothetical protein